MLGRNQRSTEAAEAVRGWAGEEKGMGVAVRGLAEEGAEAAARAWAEEGVEVAGMVSEVVDAAAMGSPWKANKHSGIPRQCRRRCVTAAARHVHTRRGLHGEACMV